MFTNIRIPLRIIELFEHMNTNPGGYSNTKIRKCPSTSFKLRSRSTALNLDVKNDRRIKNKIRKLIKTLEVSFFTIFYHLKLYTKIFKCNALRYFEFVSK